MSKNLIADAIADTKELKRLAIANARLTLAETVTPQIAALLSAKLTEDFEGKEDEVPEEDAKPENEAFNALMEKLKAEDPEKHAAIEAALSEKKEPKAEAEPDADADDAAEVKPEEEALDIDAALSEIEAGQVAESDDKDADDAEKPAEEAPSEEDAATDDDGEIDEDYVNRIMAEVEAEAEPAEAIDESDDKDADDAAEVKPEEKEEAPMDEAEANQGLLSIAAQALKKLIPGIDVEKVKKFEQDLKKAMDASAGGALGVKEAEVEKPAEEEEAPTTEQMLELQNQLMEMNLLNAKLVYQNKLLISENFSDAQKARIILAFDKVKTVNEAKLIFETLDVKSVKKPAVKPVSESLGFKRIGAPVLNESVQTAYDETDPLVAEMMKRAGIKK